MAAAPGIATIGTDATRNHPEQQLQKTDRSADAIELRLLALGRCWGA
jgi:hypothetical protein